MLNPIWLNTFKTLVELKHFTLTAERLHMTQPGVTQHIQKLEQACGHALLTRYQKRFELTEQGRLLYQYSLELQNQETELLQAMGQDLACQGVCKIASSGALALQLYPVLLAEQQNFPRLFMHFEAAPYASILQRIEQGKVDLGVVSQAIDHPLLTFSQIGHEPLCFIFPRALELDDFIAQIQKLGCIEHPDAQHYFERYRQCAGIDALAALSFERLPKASFINQLSQILLPVSLGLGWTILPQSVLNSSEYRENLQVFEPPKNVSQPLYLVQQRWRQLPARLIKMTKLIKRTLATKS